MNSNEISNSFRFNLKLQSDLRIISNWITKVIDNADLCLQHCVRRFDLDKENCG